jgi:uncharacterized protein YbaP (TraB family)
MPFSRTLFVFVLGCFFISVASAQEKYPATLLWRITGKNQTSPSYLYGTMHVQDRRLFYFGDSLYNAIEKTQGFAMEINPNDMMDSLFKSLERKDTSAYIKKILDEASYKRVAKELEKKLKMPADKITLKKLAIEKKNWANKFKRKDDMPTSMDLYLFTIARRQGKQTGGIEDVSDQLDVLNEIGTLNIDDFIKDDSAMQVNYLEKMKKIYIERDLTGLNVMVNGNNKEAFKDFLLIKRNIKMALRMDSLSQIRSSFFAVGAAHLPGESGVISLLQKNGFTVEPVFASRYIAPEEYKYNAKELVWEIVEDENKICSVQMPGTPSSISENVIPTKLYIDFADISYYGIGVTAVSEDEVKSDSFFIKIISNYKKLGFDIMSVKNIDYKGAKGIEMIVLQAGENLFRYRLLVKGNKLAIIIFGAKEKERLTDINAEKYLSSLVFNEENNANKKNWQNFTDEKNAFTMAVPGKTSIGNENDEDGIIADKYSTIDFTDGSYYAVVVRDTKAGFFIQNDSANFEEYKKNLNLATNNGVKEFSITQYKNYPACHFVAVQKVNNIDFVLQGYLVHRGNRTYIPMVASQKDRADFPEVTNFFRSFEFIPFKKTEWQRKNITKNNLSTFVPEPFTEVKKDTASYQYDEELTKYFSSDKNTGVTYSVEVEAMSPYYWAESDSSFFRKRADGFKTEADSLISYTYLNGPVKTATVLIKLNGVALYKKLKLFLNGDTTYTLYSYQPEEVLQNKYSDKFFDEVAFSQIYPSSVFENKTALLLEALKSNDSATVAKARDAFHKAVFTKKDLPLLYNAMVKRYRKDEGQYQSINELVANEIEDLNDSSVVNFVANQYAVINDSSMDVQMLLLKLLAKHKTTVSYNLLQHLLLHITPLTGSVYSLMYNITDSMNLIKGFFPSATALYADTVVGPAIMKLANELLDSGFVKPADILQNEKAVYVIAKKQLDELKADIEAYPLYNSDVIDLLGRFNTKLGNELLNQFAKVPDLWTKSNAIVALLKNNQPVLAADIMKFAKDKEWRTSFYSQLKKINKTTLFPKEFYTQQKFAESYLYNSLNEDYEIAVGKMQFIKVKTASINGKLQRYYIYKITPDDEEDEVPRIAICGAFSNSISIAEVEDADLEIYFDYEKEFSAATVEEEFKIYIDKKIKEVKSVIK